MRRDRNGAKTNVSTMHVRSTETSKHHTLYYRLIISDNDRARRNTLNDTSGAETRAGKHILVSEQAHLESKKQGFSFGECLLFVVTTTHASSCMADYLVTESRRTSLRSQGDHAGERSKLSSTNCLVQDQKN